MNTETYTYIIQFYRKAWKIQRATCLGYNGRTMCCGARHRCAWFHSPDDIDLYVLENGSRRVLVDRPDEGSDVLGRRSCFGLTNKQVKILKRKLEKCVESYYNECS